MLKDTLCILFLNLGRKQFFKYEVNCTFFIAAFYQVKILYIPNLLMVFMRNGHWILASAFSACIELYVVGFNLLRLFASMFPSDISL